jgi:hypothetical protein
MGQSFPSNEKTWVHPRFLEEEQTTQWPKEKAQKGKQ